VHIVNSALASNNGGANSGNCGGGGQGGGGLYNSAGATAEIINSTVSGNVGGGGPGFDSFAGVAGGILNNGGIVTVLNSLVVDNKGGDTGLGGGLYNYGGGTLYLTNSTVTGNSAKGAFQSSARGGALFNSGSTAIITSSTITYNNASSSGGILNSSGTVRARNTIIANNTDAGGGSDFAGALTSDGYNIIRSTSFTTITGDTTGNQTGIDPLLGTLQDNGGPTLTHALLANSPAIDAGHSSGLNTDQRGMPRPVDFSFRANATGGDGADIGAFEVQTLPPPTPTPTPSPTPTPTATPTPTPTPSPSPHLVNLSTRGRVLTGDRALIGGFIVTGNDLKKVLIRGMGPSFVSFGATLANPTLELHQGSTLITTNDDWKTRPEGTSQQSQIEATGIPPGNDLESAILAQLSPQTYTTTLAGKDGGTGVGLVEIYDLNQGADSKLANMSTRGFVDTDDNVMIGGFIVGNGSGTARAIIRALGPSVPVAGALANPTVTLYDGNGGVLASNDDWRSDQEAEIIATTIPPPSDKESAIVRDFAPGNYTAIMRGAGNTTGIGLVEIYYLQ
jgi:hypothetical protein